MTIRQEDTDTPSDSARRREDLRGHDGSVEAAALRETLLQGIGQARHPLRFETGPAGEVQALAEPRGAMTEPQGRAALERQIVEEPPALHHEQQFVMQQFLLDDRAQPVETGVLHDRIDKVWEVLPHAAACAARMS